MWDKTQHEHLKKGLVGAVLLILSLGFTCLSVFLPVTIYNREELHRVSLGIPLRFLVQNQFGVPIGFLDGPSFPVRRILISPWENPLQIIWWRFILDVLIFFVFLILVRLIIQTLRRRRV